MGVDSVGLVDGRGGHDVAVHVAAGAERGAHGLDDGGEDRLEVVLQDAVQLVRLARGQPQRAVAELRRERGHRSRRPARRPARMDMTSAPHLVGEVVHRQVELVGHHARRLAGAHHELVVLAEPVVALVPVILLIRAVELEQLHGLLGDEVVARDELLHQRVPEEVRLLLDDLHLRGRTKSTSSATRRGRKRLGAGLGPEMPAEQNIWPRPPSGMSGRQSQAGLNRRETPGDEMQGCPACPTWVGNDRRSRRRSAGTREGHPQAIHGKVHRTGSEASGVGRRSRHKTWD